MRWSGWLRRGYGLALGLWLMLFTVAPVRAQAEIPIPPESVPTVRQIFFAHAEKQEPESGPGAAVAARFKAGVEERSGGRIRVQLFPDGEVGGNRETAALIARNVVTTGLVTIGGVTPLYPPIMVTEMPFVFADDEQARAVYAGSFGQYLAEKIEAKTPFHVLGFADPGGFLLLTNSRRPILRPADLQGLKIRTIPGMDVADATITAWGATPVTILSTGELMAMGSGVLDGQMQTAAQILARHYDDVQKYVTVINHLYAPYPWLFNKAAFAAFSPEEQAMITEVAQEALATGERLARNHQMIFQAALSRRMAITALSGADLQAFREFTQPPVRALLTEKFGEEGVDLLNHLTAAAASLPTERKSAGQ